MLDVFQNSTLKIDRTIIKKLLKDESHNVQSARQCFNFIQWGENDSFSTNYQKEKINTRKHRLGTILSYLNRFVNIQLDTSDVQVIYNQNYYMKKAGISKEDLKNDKKFKEAYLFDLINCFNEDRKDNFETEPCYFPMT